MANKIYAYPAVFTPDDGSISVYFPDLEGCFTFGDNIEEAYVMAKEAAGLWLYDEYAKNTMPAATPVDKIKIEDGERIMLVEVDTTYLKRILNKTVKKNTTIPQWLSTMAEEQGLNFSEVLTEALKEKLQA